jgi:hypothetical protein
MLLVLLLPGGFAIGERGGGRDVYIHKRIAVYAGVCKILGIDKFQKMYIHKTWGKIMNILR